MLRRIAVAALLVALAATLSGAPALAATTYNDTVTLIEISSGVVVGSTRVGATFVGQASGTLPGGLTVSINYEPSSPGPLVVNTIVGGSWTLAVYHEGHFRGTVRGAVIGGTAQWNSDGTLAILNAQLSVTGGTERFHHANGSGSFSGTLSHLTFPPTVTGTLQLTF
jgi:hypothetical protein